MVKSVMVRWILKAMAFPLKVYSVGNAPVKTPSKFTVFSSLPTGKMLEDLAGAYSQVFGEPPWNEEHSPEVVAQKLARELSEPPVRLVTMEGNETDPIGGFCWGTIIDPESIPERVARARFPDNIREGREKAKELMKFLDEPVLFFDELAVLRPFRRGLAPIIFLVRPLFELGWETGVRTALFWTSTSSKIKLLTTYMGFQPLCSIDDIVFMANPNFIPLLKILQHLDPQAVQRVMSFTSRVIKRRR